MGKTAMWWFFRRRAKHAQVTASLFDTLSSQIDEIVEETRRGFVPLARSFYLHDYALGLLLAAVKAGKLSQREARLGFIDFFENKFGLTRAAAASCFKASQKHYAQNPEGQGFADGLADATLLMTMQAAEGWLRRRFAFHEIDTAV